MAKSSSELRQQLSAIEANESMYVGIGPSDIAALRRMVQEEEDWLAARAVHALSRIDSADARRSVVAAADSPHLDVRVAVANAAARLPAAESDEILTKLLDDPQSAVRKFSVKSTSARNSGAIREQVSEMATRDGSQALRRVAEKKAQSL